MQSMFAGSGNPQNVNATSPGGTELIAAINIIFRIADGEDIFLSF